MHLQINCLKLRTHKLWHHKAWELTQSHHVHTCTKLKNQSDLRATSWCDIRRNFNHTLYIKRQQHSFSDHALGCNGLLLLIDTIISYKLTTINAIEKNGEKNRLDQASQNSPPWLGFRGWQIVHYENLLKFMKLAGHHDTRV
mgnify:CR=1 FL=1